MKDVDSFLEETENTVKYVISKDIPGHLRDALNQMNINERMIYPGLDGVPGLKGVIIMSGMSMNTERIDEL